MSSNKSWGTLNGVIPLGEIKVSPVVASDEWDLPPLTADFSFANFHYLLLEVCVCGWVCRYCLSFIQLDDKTFVKFQVSPYLLSHIDISMY